MAIAWLTLRELSVVTGMFREPAYNGTSLPDTTVV